MATIAFQSSESASRLAVSRAILSLARVQPSDFGGLPSFSATRHKAQRSWVSDIQIFGTAMFIGLATITGWLFATRAAACMRSFTFTDRRCIFTTTMMSDSPPMTANHALQRTRHDAVISNPCLPSAGSLSLGR